MKRRNPASQTMPASVAITVFTAWDCARNIEINLHELCVNLDLKWSDIDQDSKRLCLELSKKCRTGSIWTQRNPDGTARLYISVLIDSARTDLETRRNEQEVEELMTRLSRGLKVVPFKKTPDRKSWRSSASDYRAQRYAGVPS